MSDADPVRDSDYRLLWPGTLVVEICSGTRLPRHGEVADYEHHHHDQTVFPVRFGDRWCLMTSLDVAERTDVRQPPGRRPPHRTGFWAPETAAVVPIRRAPPTPGQPTTVTEITA